MGLKDDTIEINLEQVIYDTLATEIQKEIDANVINSLMMMYWKEQGWHTVNIGKFQDNEHAVDITHWLAEQKLVEQKHYYRVGSEFIFKRSKDAMLFALRWAG